VCIWLGQRSEKGSEKEETQWGSFAHKKIDWDLSFGVKDGANYE
jgi:hypothetical protein